MRKNELIKNSALVAICLGLNACSSAVVSVLPKQDGSVQVTALDTEKDSSLDAAVKASHKYCKENDKDAVFISDPKTTYIGTMDEKERDLIRSASKAASGIGMMGEKGSESTTTFNQAGEGGKNFTSGKDYKTITHFKCKKD